MSTASKGSRYEKEGRKIHEREEWAYYTAGRRVIYVKGSGGLIAVNHDIFGIWDAIAKRLGFRTRWIQYTVWEDVASHVNKIEKHIEEKKFFWSPMFDEPCIFARMRGGRNPHFRIIYAICDWKWHGDTAMING